MDNTKIFSFIGLEREDIPYYIAEAIAEKNRNVLVIDNSTEHSLFLSLKRVNDTTDCVEEGRLIFLRNRLFSLNNFEKFDVVVVFHGLNVDEELLDMSDKVIFVTDYLPANMRKINTYVDPSDICQTYVNRFELLFVDKASGKVSEMAIKKFYNIENAEDETIMSHDETDYALRVNFQYNGAQSYARTSSEIRSYIKKYVGYIVEDEKQRKRAEKLARKGGGKR